jgi:hypothetical protein
MNERIRELEIEAIAYADSKVPAMDRYNDIYHSIVRGKFAELIVRECAEVAQDFVTAENNKLVETIHISPWRLQDKIKERFGVEE